MDFFGHFPCLCCFLGNHRSLKCVFTHQELPRGKVLKEFPLTMVGISREEDLGTCSPFFFFSVQFLEHGEVEFFFENWTLFLFSVCWCGKWTGWCFVFLEGR